MKHGWLAACLVAMVPFAQAQAHGLAGDRFFPATLVIDDPAVADELTLPQIGISKERQDDGTAPWVTHNAFEFSKRITKDFGLSFEGDYMHRQGVNGNPHENGFDNFAIAAKYQLLTSAEHEAIISAGVDWDIGGTGSSRVGAEGISTIMPQVFFGKGFGDLPDSADYLKPFAVTGVVGVSMPDNQYSDGAGNPDSLDYGFTLQYSLPYLQQHVKDVGLTAPFNRLIPLVEFSFEKPLNRADSYTTTGTVNPGFIWVGQSTQVAVEAILPINRASGSGVGAMAQLHFYLDDLLPTTMGKPLLGN